MAEVRHLPLGHVLDQIACWQIAECGAKQLPRRDGGSLFDQMKAMERR